MDYGKTAYVKVCDLESRLHKQLTAAPKNRTGMNFRPFFDFAAGDYEAAEISADGVAAIIVKAEVRADSDVENVVISLKIDGIVASSSAGSNMTKGERYDFLLLAAADPGTDSVLSLSAGNADCTLLSCQIVISGDGAKLGRGSGDCAVDKCGSGKWLAVECEDDDIAAYVFDETEPFSLGDPVYIGTGRRADCAGGDDSFVAVYVDTCGNAYAAFVSCAQAVTKTVYIAGEVTAIAIGRCGSGFITAEIDGNGGVACRYLTGGGGVSMPFDPGITDFAERVGFVKNADRPTLIVGTRDRSYVKYVEVDYGGADAFDWTAAVTITKTEDNGENESV